MTEYPKSTWIHPKSKLKDSKIHRKALHSTSSIRKGETVIIFGGIVFSTQDVDMGKANTQTLLQLDEDSFIGDPADSELGEDYYINHSCELNLWFSDGVTLTSRRNIQKRDEVTMDYGTEFSDPKWKLKARCNCGTPTCRKIITGNDWHKPELQKKYAGHFTPFTNHKVLNSTEWHKKI